MILFSLHWKLLFQRKCWQLDTLVKPIIRLHQVECVPQVSTSSTSIPSTSRLWNCWVSQVPTGIVGGLEMFATIPPLPAQDADCAAKSANQCNVARRAGRTINLWICPAPTFIVSDGGVLSSTNRTSLESQLLGQNSLHRRIYCMRGQRNEC